MILLVFVNVFCQYWKLLSLLSLKLEQSHPNVNKTGEYLSTRYALFTLQKSIKIIVLMREESINITIDAVQKKRLIEEAHKRNFSLKEYLRLLVINL